jgi:hypothetical protein
MFILVGVEECWCRGGAKGKMKENVKNVKNREHEVVFGRMIER